METLDISHLLQNQAVEEQSSAENIVHDTETNHAEDGTHAGLLTRTIIRSTVVKQILQARIRSSHHNDVVFIGDHHIELYEIVGNHGTLVSVAYKNDFQSRIRAAQVLGTPDTLRAFEEEFINFDGGSIKQEQEETTNAGTSSSSPPQTILITLDSHELCFVTARLPLNGDDVYEFCMLSLPTPASSMPLLDAGQRIAVDGKSRAFALAAWQGVIFLCNAHFKSSRALVSPITSSIALPCSFHIFNMEFLAGTNSQSDTVYLLVVGAASGKPRFGVYSWDSSKRLVHSEVHSYYRSLGAEHSIHNILIPLKSPGSFLLACETSLTVYAKAHLGHVEQTTCIHQPQILDEQNGPACPGESRRFPLLVAWGRPRRNNSFMDDWLYLGREDGMIMYLQLQYASDVPRITSRGWIGRLDCNLGCAFAVVDLGVSDVVSHVQGPDVVLAVGELSDGGRWEIGRIPDDEQMLTEVRELHMAPIKQQTFTNHAPFTDLAVRAPSLDHRAARSSEAKGLGVFSTTADSESFGTNPSTTKERSQNDAQPRLFVTSGKGRSGAVCEIRYGCAASIEAYLDLADIGLPLANELYPLSSFVNNYDALIVSSPVQSVLIIDPTGELFGLQEIGMESTLAACILDGAEATFESDIAIQVVPSGVRALFLRPDGIVEPAAFWDLASISSASVDSRSGLMIICYNHGTNISLCLKRVVPLKSLGKISFDLKNMGQSVILHDEVTALALHVSQVSEQARAQQVTAYVFVAVSGQQLAVYHFTVDQNFDHLVTYVASLNPLRLRFLHDIKILSPRSLNALETSTTLHLALGMRSGDFWICSFEHDSATHKWTSDIFQDSRHYELGTTPVMIRCYDAHDRHEFVLLCDSELYCLRYDQQRPADATRIVLTKLDDTSFIAPRVHHLGLYSSYLTRPNVVLLSRERVLFSHLIPVPQDVSRKIPVKGTPNRILFSEHLNLLIVGGNITHAIPGTDLRTANLIVQLVSPDWQETSFESASQDDSSAIPVVATFEGDAGETLCALLEWSIARDGAVHNFIIVTTMETHPPTTSHPTGRRRGAIRFLKVILSRAGVYTIVEYQASKENEPVYAICSFESQTALLYCVGNEIKMRTYLPEQKKFHKTTLSQLPSPGLHISTKGTEVYVTTARHSTKIFKYLEGSCEPADVVSQDVTAREGLVHFTVPGAWGDESGVFFSTKNRSVILMTTREQPVGDPDATPEPPHLPPRIREARLNTSVTRFGYAPMRSPWLPSSTDVGERAYHRHIFGVTPDGAVLEFSSLNATTWRFLRFLQNMWVRHLEPRSLAARRHLEPATEQATDGHVDGDVLASLMDRPDAAGMLRRLLDAEPAAEASTLDFATAADRRKRFEALLQAVPMARGPAMRPLSSGEGPRLESAGSGDSRTEEDTLTADAPKSLATMTAQMSFSEDERQSNRQAAPEDEGVRRTLAILRELLACSL